MAGYTPPVTCSIWGILPLSEITHTITYIVCALFSLSFSPNPHQIFLSLNLLFLVKHIWLNMDSPNVELSIVYAEYLGPIPFYFYISQM